MRAPTALAAALLASAAALAACTQSATHRTPATSAPPNNAPPTSAAPAVAVSPYPDSRTSLPQTTISFRGVAAARLGTITVTGSRTGRHAGRMVADSDGQGADFVPSQPFGSGETVTVTTALDVVGGEHGAWHFQVATPVAEPALTPTVTEDPALEQHYVSAPELRPPLLTVDRGTLSAADGDLFLAPKGGAEQNGPMITDAAGRLVWFSPLPAGLRAYDLRVQRYRNQPVLTYWQGRLTRLGLGQGEAKIVDDHYRPVATVRAGNGLLADHHEFTISRTDTAFVTAYQALRWDVSSLGGPHDGIAVDSVVQEIDIPTGNVLAEWHALDHIPISASYRGYAAPWDAYHINSIQDLGGGRLLISAKCTHQLYELDLATGHILWRLGGKQSDFTGDGTVFSSQHDARLDGSRLTLFDNARSIGPTTEQGSRGLVVDLSTAAHTAKVEVQLKPDAFTWADNQGNVQTLPGGDYVVGWGSEPYVGEYAPDGTLRWEAHLPTGDTSYRAYRFAWNADPPGAPSVAVRAGTAYVSWNGATRVAQWQVLAGDPLRPLRTVARTGFETRIALGGAGGRVQVVALDANGARLGASAVVPG